MATTTFKQSGFERIHAALYIHTPATHGQRTNTTDPDTILYFPGADTIAKTILKYTSHYQHIYPHARIILCLTSFSDIARHSTGRKDLSLSPVIDILLGAEARDSRILIQICSNGGAYMFRELASAYKRRAGKMLTFNMLVLDSSPGLHDFWKNLFAFQAALPRFFVLYYAGTLLALIYLTIQHVSMVVTGRKPVVEEVWESLNDVELVDGRAQRLYLWSKTDQFIDWHDVRLHSGTAKRRDGCNVKSVEFFGSRHCGHVLVDKDKYWNAITDTWNETQERRPQR